MVSCVFSIYVLSTCLTASCSHCAVLIGARDTVKLADFGLALQLASREELAKGYVGTPGYMAPEFKRNCPQPTHGLNADVWSMGKVIEFLGKELKRAGEVRPFVSYSLQDREKRPSSQQLMDWLLHDSSTQAAARRANESSSRDER